MDALRKGQGGAVCALAVGSVLLLPGSALPSLELPKVPSLPMHSRLSGSGDMFTPLCRRACSYARPAAPLIATALLCLFVNLEWVFSAVPGYGDSASCAARDS